MKALTLHNVRIEHHTWRLAVTGCAAIDLLLRKVTPADLQKFQEYLASELLSAESRLSVLTVRKGRRSERIRALIRRAPELRTRLHQHRTALITREKLLRDRCGVLRQLGDACAWIVLRGDPRLLVPLYGAERSHRLPTGLGFDGPWEILNQLHATGEFLVIANDLTRCLGIGDLTITPLNRSWTAPLSLEIKSRPGEGRFAEIEMFSAYANHPEFQALFADVVRALNLQETEPGAVRDARIQRQMQELLERLSVVFELRAKPRERTRAAKERHWRTVETVLNRAYMAGSAFDEPEPGVLFTAIRVYQNRAVEASIRRLTEIAAEQGQPLSGATTRDLFEAPKISPVVPPIALWPITGDLRNSLLAGRLFFAVYVARDAWSKAFSDLGINWREEGGCWHLDLDGEKVILDRIETARAKLGVVFAGVSPRSAAAAIRATILNPVGDIHTKPEHR